MESTQSLDVVSIASRVWEALEPHDARQPAKRGGAPDAGRVAPSRAPSLEELASCVSELGYQLDRTRQVQEHLEQQILSLEGQLRALPAYVVRLEQWNAQMETRLCRLDRADAADTATTHAATAPSQGGSSSGLANEESLDAWLDVNEVARLLAVSPGTVRRYIRRGNLPAARLLGGRGWRLRRSDIESCLASRASDRPDGG